MAAAPVETEQAPATTATGKGISSEALGAVAAMGVYDEDGGEVAFGSLYEQQKTIVIFVRVRRVISVANSHKPCSIFMGERGHRGVEIVMLRTSAKGAWLLIKGAQSISAHTSYDCYIEHLQLCRKIIIITFVWCKDWHFPSSCKGSFVQLFCRSHVFRHMNCNGAIVNILKSKSSKQLTCPRSLYNQPLSCRRFYIDNRYRGAS